MWEHSGPVDMHKRSAVLLFRSVMSPRLDSAPPLLPGCLYRRTGPHTGGRLRPKLPRSLTAPANFSDPAGAFVEANTGSRSQIFWNVLERDLSFEGS
jgi:hypothetical protein